MDQNKHQHLLLTSLVSCNKWSKARELGHLLQPILLSFLAPQVIISPVKLALKK